MDEQFKYVVKKSLNKINKDKNSYILNMDSKSLLSAEPRFYWRGKNDLDCWQRDYMGFYVLRNAYRGILQGINYLLAGDINLSKKLLGPSVCNYYSGAYHLFGTYLALKARLIFDRFILFETKKSIDVNKFAIASFTNGKWHFESLKWSHLGKWKQLKQLKVVDYPDSFRHLFEYWFGFRIKEDLPYMDRLNTKIKGKPLGTPLQIKNIPDEFINRIAESRHQAIYYSYGSDSEVMTNLINRDAYTDLGIGKQAKIYKKFCYSFLIENIVSLIKLLNFVRLHKQTRLQLWNAICKPLFDTPQIELIEDKNIRNKLKAIKDFLLLPRQRHIPPTI